MWMFWVGVAIVIMTFWLIFKNYEARIVLTLAGALTALIGGDLGGAVNAFVKQLVNGDLVPTITVVMGFGALMVYTKCSEHLVAALVQPLRKVPFIIIPGAVIITWFLNIALPSAGGIAAAVGVLLIPTLIALKVKPAMAASAVYLGTWGSVVSPGLMFNPQIAEIAKTDVMTVIATEFWPCILGLVAATIVLVGISLFRKEGVGSYVPQADDKVAQTKEDMKVNYLYALVPVIPLVLLVISSKQVGWISPMSVPVAMLIGSAIALVVTRPNLGDASKKFCKGAGDGFGDVVILIAAAAFFCAGMKSMGMIDVLINAMKGSQSVAQIAAAAGPFVMAVVTGSGNAAALAFNGAITPHAADFGLGTVELGAVAQIAAGLGRTMSPVAGAAIICAGLAGINPMEIVKRNALPTVVAVVVVTVAMFI